MPWKEEDKRGVQQDFEYIMEVHESRAGFTSYNEGNTPLQILEGEKEFSNGKRQEDHMWLSVGDFEPDDDGKKWLHTSGDASKRFSAQSKYAQFISSAIDVGVPLEDVSENSLDATMWKGMKLRVVDEEKTSTIAGEERKWRQPKVKEFLGWLPGHEKAGNVSGGNNSSTYENIQSTSAAGNGDGPTEDEVAALAKEFKAEGKEHIDFLAEASKKWGLRVTDPRLSEEAWEKV